MGDIKKNIKKYGALLIIKIFNLLPIKNNKIFLESYYGSQYGCNPKYISEYIVNNYSKGKFDVVWSFTNLDGKESIKGVRKVKTMSLKYFYELCTSKIIITNYRTTDMFIKRKNQYYIQTWHSSLRLKKIEKDAKETLKPEYIEMAKRDSKKLDLLLSGCRYSTKIFRDAFWYDGKILECGTPRNDLFFMEGEENKKYIKEKLGIAPDKKVILYAPTFRKDNKLDVYNIDYDKVTMALKNKFGGEWVFIIRLHPHLVNRSKEIIKGQDIIDATKYDDIQELLSISDVLISDYSSLMFDFAPTKRPCFLYVPDLYEYTKNDRGLYFDIEELPFINIFNNDEFKLAIENFDKKQYDKKIDEFSYKIGSFEDGKACERMMKCIEKICF